ncbi:hypothetical protein BO82DRAFT_406628 [Aspergillus uvarum CBS 121591]|uniref:Amino acid transporter n=1 Tax=Aspergillus uvarum CBS 121591 TaxID=1448315 RepID=A0A319BXX5_9EURO|nr:hypothetical protein BO82DRAFT_406628 [Aspergillus uvarum CBS 121591]PYH77017.1 hypothetical protein BO82DRAFT_406628 [Aspergillus uvarum CBS 121591]
MSIQPESHSPHIFGLWSAIGLGWLTLNVFGTLSFIIVVGLPAGGVPVILYGFIGSNLAVICMVMTFAQCASRFSTAGGAYHYACFLIPPQYRRQIAYPLGWLNYLGWIFTHAGACAIVATLTLGLIKLCNPEIDVSPRWKLFVVYISINTLCWLFNLVAVRGIPTMELLGCYATAFGFVAYTIALLVKAPKADSKSVFVQVNDETGFQSHGFAILLGLVNSFGTMMGLDGPAHLAEELPRAKILLPRIMMIVILSQFVVGLVWIIVLGFSITDVSAITSSATRVPVLEIIRLGTGSNAAAIAFCLILIINNATSALGSAVTMSRQGYAFARDGGLFWNAQLTKRSSNSNLPFWSITLPSLVCALVGLIYLFSSSAYNAFVGSQVTCMIISFGSPALILLITGGQLLPACDRWNFGVWSTPIYLISVLHGSGDGLLGIRNGTCVGVGRAQIIFASVK